MSGEIIQLAPTTNLIFEPMDLEVASPATVSLVIVMVLLIYNINGLNKEECQPSFNIWNFEALHYLKAKIFSKHKQNIYLFCFL